MTVSQSVVRGVVGNVRVNRWNRDLNRICWIEQKAEMIRCQCLGRQAAQWCNSLDLYLAASMG